MPTMPESAPIPEHQPIVPCPQCGPHTPHMMPQMGQYKCLTCDTVHGLAPLRKVHQEQDPVWCPTCRVQEGSNVWAAVQGRRQCRVCLTWIVVVTKEEHAHG